MKVDNSDNSSPFPQRTKSCTVNGVNNQNLLENVGHERKKHKTCCGLRLSPSLLRTDESQKCKSTLLPGQSLWIMLEEV